MRILSKTISFIALVLLIISIILAILYYPYSQLMYYETNIFKLSAIACVLLFIRTLLIPRFLTRHMRRQKQEIKEHENGKIDSSSRYERTICSLTIVVIVLLVISFILFFVAGHVGDINFVGESLLEKCRLLCMLMIMLIWGILGFVLPPELSGERNADDMQ